MTHTVTSVKSWERRRSSLEQHLIFAAALSISVCFALTISVAFLSGVAFRSHQVQDSAEICLTPGCIHTASQLLKDMDVTIDPCDDFYKYACGNFIKNTVIPDGSMAVSTYTAMSNKENEQLRIAIEAPLRVGDPEAFKLAKSVYTACMNKTVAEERKLNPVQDILNRFDGWPVVLGNKWPVIHFSWKKLDYLLREEGFHADYVISLEITADNKNSTRRTFKLDQPYLSLGRVHLIKGLEEKLVREYHQYQVDMAVIFGADRRRAEKEMKDVLDFEIQLANISLPPEESRNISRIYLPMKISELEGKFPFLPGRGYLRRLLPSNIKIYDDEIIDVYSLPFLSKLENILNHTSNRVIANYMIWRAVSSVVKYLHKKARDRELRFYTAVFGLKERGSRWKECIIRTVESMDIAVGALYVRRYFDEDAKRETTDIVARIRQEMINIIERIKWMDDATRNAAVRKMRAMAEHIGYPDEFLNNSKIDSYYDGLAVDSHLYLETMLNITKFKNKFSLSRFRQPINKTDWIEHAYVPVVNAFYTWHENSIVIPAGILQGIFFSKEVPRYMNYGGIGTVIGHEITHGFDDRGRQYDDQGNLVDWWAKETQTRYIEKARCIIEQYGNYTATEVNMKLNGVNNQGENIADNGGLKQAYRAYVAWNQKYGPEPLLPGLQLSPRQLFWVSAAYTYCTKGRPEFLRTFIPIGQHSPDEFRVRGPFSNQKDFARDFACPLGSNMNPAHKCQVW